MIRRATVHIASIFAMSWRQIETREAKNDTLRSFIAALEFEVLNINVKFPQSFFSLRS